MKITKRTLTQSPRRALVMALLVSFSFPQTAVSQSYFEGLLNKGKEMLDTAISKGRDLAAKGKEMADLAIQKGEDMGKRTKAAQERTQKDLQMQMAALKKEFAWVESYKEKLEGDIAAHLDKLRDTASSGAAMAADGYAIAVDGIDIAAEKVQALKSQLVTLVVAAKVHQKEQEKKVVEAGTAMKDHVDTAVAEGKKHVDSAITKGKEHMDSAIAKGKEHVDTAGAIVKEGAVEASAWVYKFKNDLTSLAAQAKEAFAKNKDGLMEKAEWDSFAKAFGLDGDVVANSDGKITDEELDKALENNIEKLQDAMERKSSESSGKKHDEM